MLKDNYNLETLIYIMKSRDLARFFRADSEPGLTLGPFKRIPHLRPPRPRVISTV
jgi:hypothetical protein